MGLRLFCHNTNTVRVRMWVEKGGEVYCWSCHKLGLGVSSAFKEGGEGRLSWRSLSLASSRLPASSNLVSFSRSIFSSPCSSSMDSRAGLMMLSAAWCLRSTYSDMSFSREEERLSALHSLPSFSTIHSIAALPLLLFEDTVLTMIPSMLTTLQKDMFFDLISIRRFLGSTVEYSLA